MFIHFRKFTEMQKSILITCYNAGMIGVGQKYTSLIEAAATQAELTPQQVKVHVTTCMNAYIIIICTHTCMHMCGLLYIIWYNIPYSILKFC